MQSLTKFFIGVLTIASTLSASASSSPDSISYIPHVHGTLRPRLEMSTEGHPSYRFALRNARASIDGMIAPSIDYYIQADFCDRGKIKFLDGWARLKVTKGLKFQAGQFRMPFGIDPFRAPHTYIFANRSFIGRQMFNYRAVGAKLSYTLPKAPLTIEAGLFNPSTIADHTPWNHTIAFGSKATYRIGNVSLEAGFASISPDSCRINAFDGAITWKSGRWLAEAEYLNKHYANRDRKDCHGYNAYIDYHMPIKAGIFNKLSFQGRFDGMTAHSNGTRNELGQLVTDDPARNRVTIGSTISYIHNENIFLDIRANYEKYFYHSGVEVTPEMGDKILLEMVLRF